MKQYLWLILTAFALLTLFGDAFAGRLTSISGGVAGSSYEKIRQLKTISLVAGGLFILMSLGMSSLRKKVVMPRVVPIIVFLVGVALVSLKFVL